MLKYLFLLIFGSLFFLSCQESRRQSGYDSKTKEELILNNLLNAKLNNADFIKALREYIRENKVPENHFLSLTFFIQQKKTIIEISQEATVAYLESDFPSFYFFIDGYIVVCYTGLERLYKPQNESKKFLLEEAKKRGLREDPILHDPPVWEYNASSKGSSLDKNPDSKEMMKRRGVKIIKFVPPDSLK